MQENYLKKKKTKQNKTKTTNLKKKILREREREIAFLCVGKLCIKWERERMTNL